MQRKLRNIVVVGLAGSLLVVIAFWQKQKSHRIEPATSTPEPITVSTKLTPNTPLSVETNALYGALRSASTNLLASKERTIGQKFLAELRQTLSGTQTNEASAAIQRFLDSKIDAPTGQGFKINANHFLDQAPTLRTFLMDYLEEIDPSAAAA